MALIRPSSIQTRLTAGIGAAVALLVTLMGAYWVQRNERDLLDALDARAAATAQLAARGLAAPVWNLDSQTIGNLLDAVLADSEVQSVELTASGLDSKTLHRDRQPHAEAALWREEPVLYRTDPQQATARFIGTVRLGFNHARLRAAAAEARVFALAVLAAVLMAVVAASWWIVAAWCAGRWRVWASWPNGWPAVRWAPRWPAPARTRSAPSRGNSTP